MPIPELFHGRLTLPVIGAPMFLASGPELVMAQCKAGVPGVFPSVNARSPGMLEEWLARIERELEAFRAAHPGAVVAPFGVNLIVHSTNPRLPEDLALVVKHRVPFIVTSVGKPAEAVRAVHAYGGIVFHDVTTVKYAHKAIEAGVDGLILVCAGAGGHAGTLSPFAFVAEVREFWSGPIALAGAISSGQAIRAAEILGADFAYLGTRFLATTEANVPASYKRMIVDHAAADILYTSAFSGVPGNYLRPSIAASGIDAETLVETPGKPALKMFAPEANQPKAWKDIWSAGHGIGTIHEIRSAAEVIADLRKECQEASGGQPSEFIRP
ncbi:MAG: nitronate monooxygenase [Verrucomicrobia bacterium]|nr:nitronate monooxygenase [Verrucomicrobiota bacterium]